MPKVGLPYVVVSIYCKYKYFFLQFVFFLHFLYICKRYKQISI